MEAMMSDRPPKPNRSRHGINAAGPNGPRPGLLTAYSGDMSYPDQENQKRQVKRLGDEVDDAYSESDFTAWKRNQDGREPVKP